MTNHLKALHKADFKSLETEQGRVLYQSGQSRVKKLFPGDAFVFLIFKLGSVTFLINRNRSAGAFEKVITTSVHTLVLVPAIVTTGLHSIVLYCSVFSFITIVSLLEGVK